MSYNYTEDFYDPEYDDYEYPIYSDEDYMEYYEDLVRRLESEEY